jgi:hypothetical protein
MFFPVGLFGGGAAAVGGGGTPITIFGSKLVAYYDTKASPIAQSGGKISQINDLSGHNYHMVQANALKQPAYNATGFGAGKPSVFFEAAAGPDPSFLKATGLTLGGNKCTCAVIATFAPPGGEWGTLAGITDSAYANPLVLIGAIADTPVLNTQRNNSDRSTGGISGLNTRFHARSRFTGTQNIMNIEGVDQTPASDSANFDATVDFSWGGRPNLTQNWRGHAAVLILLNDVMSAGEATAYNAWATAW